MITYLIFEGIIAFLFTIYLYCKYAQKDISLIVKIVTIITWFFTFITIIIIPNDISLRKDDIKSDNEKEELIIFIIYNIVYWTIFILSWIIVPLLSEYESSGYLNKKDKFRHALITNLFYYLLFLVLGIAFIIYLLIKKQLTVYLKLF